MQGAWTISSRILRFGMLLEMNDATALLLRLLLRTPSYSLITKSLTDSGLGDAITFRDTTRDEQVDAIAFQDAVLDKMM